MTCYAAPVRVYSEPGGLFCLFCGWTSHDGPSHNECPDKDPRCNDPRHSPPPHDDDWCPECGSVAGAKCSKKPSINGAGVKP